MNHTQAEDSNGQTILNFGATGLSKIAITMSTLGLLLGGLMVSIFAR